MSGAAVKPICLRLVVDVMKTVPNAQIFGLGGIVTWYDAMEYMMLEGRRKRHRRHVVRLRNHNLVEGTVKFLKENGYSTVQDAIGKALSKFIAHSDLGFEKWARTSAGHEKCIACSRCIATCQTAGKGALYMDTERMVVRTDLEKCGGCGICQYAPLAP